MKLIARLFCGLMFGLIIGLIGPAWCICLLVTLKSAIGQLIAFSIPFIILFFVTHGLSHLPTTSNRLLGQTLFFAYTSTIIAGLLAVGVGLNVFPNVERLQFPQLADKLQTYKPFIELTLTPFFDVMSALIAAFVFGVGIHKTQANTLKQVIDEGKKIIELLLARIIVPILPVYIAGVTAEMAGQGQIYTLVENFGLVLVLAIALHWLWLLTIYSITGLALGHSPFALLRNMLPAYFTALGTMSSAATIPVGMAAVKKNGVRDEIANFGVPLCANIHLCGSTITLTLCAMAVMSLTQSPETLNIASLLPFVLALGVVMVAAPGTPGGGVMSALSLLTSFLGFGDVAIALMIALYVAQDGFGTACNVTCDGALTLWLDRINTTLQLTDETKLSSDGV